MKYLIEFIDLKNELELIYKSNSLSDDEKIIFMSLIEEINNIIERLFL